jgi:hypothetical protein
MNASRQQLASCLQGRARTTARRGCKWIAPFAEGPLIHPAVLLRVQGTRGSRSSAWRFQLLLGLGPVADDCPQRNFAAIAPDN